MSLRESIEKIRRSPVPANEQETITTILMILRDLGWDPFGEEVRQEYPVGGGRIDIALIAPSRVVAFIEAKAPGEYLHRHVDQIVGYAFREGADICALTNGTEWWLYLPLERLPFEQRRFAVLKTREDPIEQLADDLETFLGKHNLLSRQAERRAKCVLEAKREADHLKTKIPEVWNQMVAGPDDDLVELVGKRVYEKTSLRPAKEQVAAALRGSPIPTVVKSKPARPTPKPTPPTPPGAGRQRPTAVRLWGQRYDVKNWTDMLVTVADALHGRQGADFDRVLDKRGKKHPWASRSRDDIPWAPKLVGSSGIYIETGFDAGAMERRARGLLRLFGFDGSELEILLETAPAGPPVPSSDPLPSERPDRILLWGEHYPVKSWKDILFGVASALHDRYGDRFDRVVTDPPRGLGLPRASYSPEGIARSQPVGTSGLYMTRNWSRAPAGRAIVAMLEFLGHDISEITFIATESP